MSRMHGRDSCCVSILDFMSDDGLSLCNAARALTDIPVLFTKDASAFNRSVGRNRAVEAAPMLTGDIVWFIDADMLVPRSLPQTTRSHVAPGAFWAPVCYSLHADRPAAVDGDSWKPGRSNGWWRHEGHGNFAVIKEDYDRVGRWDESRGRTYGKEDDDIFHRMRASLRMERGKLEGFFHQYHPVSWRRRYESPPVKR